MKQPKNGSKPAPAKKISKEQSNMIHSLLELPSGKKPKK